MDEPAPIRVILCDDHPVVRRGLVALLNGTDGIEVVGTASDGEEAIALAAETRPDVVLMDVSMPGMDGVETTERLLRVHPAARVIMLTSFADRAKDALQAGAVGYILKDSEPERLIRGIHTAMQTERKTD